MEISTTALHELLPRVKVRLPTPYEGRDEDGVDEGGFLLGTHRGFQTVEG